MGSDGCLFGPVGRLLLAWRGTCLGRGELFDTAPSATVGDRRPTARRYRLRRSLPLIPEHMAVALRLQPLLIPRWAGTPLAKDWFVIEQIETHGRPGPWTNRY